MQIPKIIRFIFLKETIILLFAFVFLWFGIGLYVDSQYNLSNLKPHTGEIVNISGFTTTVKDKPLYKEVKRELHFSIDSEKEVFTLETRKRFDSTILDLRIGDKVTIFTKPKLWGIFGLKGASVINHLTKEEKTIIDYSTYKNSISGLFYLPIIFSIILFIVYIVKFRQRLWWDFDGYKSAKRIS